MPRYVLDSNVYIQATRDAAFNQELEAFLWTAAPFVHMHSVVAGELLAGAVHPELERRTYEQFIEPYEAMRRVVTPSHPTWRRAGGIVAQLIRSKRLAANGVPRSFFNDCLIAASAREHGFTLVTRNTADFELIGGVERVDVVAPWPQ